MLDRSSAPSIKSIQNILFPKIEIISLKNGINVHLLPDNSLDILRIDFVFNSGAWQQTQALVSGFTVEMLREGNRKYSSQKIAESLDFHASWLQLSSNFHNSFVSIYSLHKHFENTLDIAQSLIIESVFPKTEFDVLLNKKKQQYQINQQKVQSIANCLFSESIYGKEFPYGKSAQIGDFDKINTSLLNDFYQKHYHAGNCEIILSGKIDNGIIAALEDKFGGNDWKKERIKDNSSFIPTPSENKKHHIAKPNSVQTAIKIGKPGISRKHADYHKLRILLTILGGYFGSRLMSNIREEKGYTYGIIAGLSSLREAGSIAISTQTANKYVSDLIKEVYSEMDILRKEPISSSELEIVKNYMLGGMARAFDGIFSITESYLSLLTYNLSPEFHQTYLETIKSISPQELKSLAEQYLNPSDFHEITVG